MGSINNPSQSAVTAVGYLVKKFDTTPMLNAGNLLPLILIGGAFLLFTMKK